MSVPIVAGAAALLLEKYPNIRLDSKGRIALNMEFLNVAYYSVNDLLKAYDAEMIRNHYISQTELVG